MKRPVHLLLFLFILIIVLAVLKIAITNTIATTGITLGQMQKQISVLNTQNYIIAQKYLAAASLVTISQKAQKLGFQSNTNDYFVTQVEQTATTQ
jgi:ribulose bisphosphate carboxylase small subunit